MKLKRLWYLHKGTVTTPEALFNDYTEKLLEKHGITRKLGYQPIINKNFWIYTVKFSHDACFSIDGNEQIQYLGRKKWSVINE